MSLSKALGVVNGINEFSNFSQLAASAVSYLRSQWKATQEQNLQEDDVLQLQSDLRCLRDTLPAMHNLIDRGEWRSHEDCLAELLQQLKDAVYDAEDLIDEFRWYELNVSEEGNANSVQPVIDFFRSVTQGRFNKVTSIHKRLNNLSSQLEKMGLHKATPRFDKSLRPETTSFPTEPKIFGRDKELEELIRLLGVPTDSSRTRTRKRKGSGVRSSAGNQVSVLPIVGIGGVGKTTLAQRISEHPHVQRHFGQIIWTCVSDDFDVKRLTEDVIHSFSTREATTDHLDSLQRTLADKVKKQRFLLILDDMWDDSLKENGGCWRRFCAPFTNAVEGSMMLVTTRSQNVTDLVRTMDTFPLTGLQDDALWDFFKQCAFGSYCSDIDPELERIGKKILPKLRGSPLAAKTLGRLLGTSHDTVHWNNILMSELWELKQKETDILPALRLSYIYLPFHLKRCFSFCAVYPKDHEFEKDSLAEIWVAEGFVASQGNRPLQDIGRRYFEGLVKRSFFQIVDSKYVIHDLMHDMAQLVSKDECFIIKNLSDIQKVPQNVRHLSILKNSVVKCSDLSSIGKHSKLRTLLCKEPLIGKTDTSMLERWCDKLQCMRVIIFAQTLELPKNIFIMKHLRYLEINKLCNHFRCEYLYQKNLVYSHERATDEAQKRKLRFNNNVCGSLPTWFHPRYFPNLAILSVYRCSHLERISLPGNSSLVINANEAPGVLVDRMAGNSISSTFSSLIDLAIESCTKLSSLEKFLQPANIPVVKRIVIADCPILELVPTERFGDLHFLEELKVCNCPQINSRRLLAQSLKKLELQNSGNLGENIECWSLTCLHLLHNHQASIKLQEWNLPVLQELTIGHCALLKVIRESEPISTDLTLGSSIGKFPLLTHLTIEHCHNLETLDVRFLHLPAIKCFNITCCDRLSLPTERFGSFPFLEELILWSCPRLNWGSGMLLPSSLKKLELWSCGDFSPWFPSCLENLSSLQSLTLRSCEGIESIPGHLWSIKLAALQELRIDSCTNLKSIGGQRAIANIKNICIQNCPKLKEVKQPL